MPRSLKRIEFPALVLSKIGGIQPILDLRRFEAGNDQGDDRDQQADDDHADAIATRKADVLVAIHDAQRTSDQPRGGTKGLSDAARQPRPAAQLTRKDPQPYAVATFGLGSRICSSPSDSGIGTILPSREQIASTGIWVPKSWTRSSETRLAGPEDGDNHNHPTAMRHLPCTSHPLLLCTAPPRSSSCLCFHFRQRSC